MAPLTESSQVLGSVFDPLEKQEGSKPSGSPCFPIAASAPFEAPSCRTSLGSSQSLSASPCPPFFPLSLCSVIFSFRSLAQDLPLLPSLLGPAAFTTNLPTPYKHHVPDETFPVDLHPRLDVATQPTPISHPNSLHLFFWLPDVSPKPLLSSS